MKYKRKSTGEKELFFEIWNERIHYCINCNEYLGNEAKSFHFSHIKPKGLYPELRLDKNNIQLLCFDCHYAYDFQSKEKYNERKEKNKI